MDQPQFPLFSKHKEQCLSKRDKSFAGRIDPKAVEICSIINERPNYYTTSSCSGRAFLYQGSGVKAFTDTSRQKSFRRWRIAHDVIDNPQRYFDLTTLASDPTGGADPVRTIGQFDHAERVRELREQEQGDEGSSTDRIDSDLSPLDSKGMELVETEATFLSMAPAVIWLRYEPFILHVCCRSLTAASNLMTRARPAFKNVGLTSWKVDKGYYLVAIWGDEGLDMPLCDASGNFAFSFQQDWLAQLINERHTRNWKKLDRFVQAMREMENFEDDCQVLSTEEDNHVNSTDRLLLPIVPRSFDVIGDVALLHSMPRGDEAERKRVGEIIMKKNRAIKVCVARRCALMGTERAADMLILAGAQRSPLITTHAEYGIRCVVDLNRTFFSPRMGRERLRICQQVARGENVLVLFAGVGMEALQIAGRTEASSVMAIELNRAAVECARRGHRLLKRTKGVKCVGASERLTIVEGNILEVLPTMENDFFDRILAPRPKEGALDGDLGTGNGGATFLHALLPHLNNNGGECHWYDFASDTEFPLCERSRQTIELACRKQGLKVQIINVSRAGSVATHQLRICLDFRLCGRSNANNA